MLAVYSVASTPSTSSAAARALRRTPAERTPRYLPRIETTPTVWPSMRQSSGYLPHRACPVLLTNASANLAARAARAFWRDDFRGGSPWTPAYSQGIAEADSSRGCAGDPLDTSSHFATLTVAHRCGHAQSHALPQGLSQTVRDGVAATLSEQRCWRCVTGDAWESLPPWTPPPRQGRTRRRPTNGES